MGWLCELGDSKPKTSPPHCNNESLKLIPHADDVVEIPIREGSYAARMVPIRVALSCPVVHDALEVIWGVAGDGVVGT